MTTGDFRKLKTKIQNWINMIAMIWAKYIILWLLHQLHGIASINEIEKSNDINYAKRPCPTTLQAIQVLGMGSTNCKLQKIDTMLPTKLDEFWPHI